MEDLLSLAEAAALLDRKPVTLRAAIDRGRFKARKFGNTWVTTRAEVERYRRENLGQVGRPPNLLEQRPPFEDVTGKPGEPNLLDRDR